MDSKKDQVGHHFKVFDHAYLVENPGVLRKLAQFYVDTWKFDENFGEFMQCPGCKAYFNQHQVEVKGIKNCTHCEDHPKLVEAWNPESVAQEILEDTEKYTFYGVLIFSDSEEVIGFAWGRVISYDDVVANWSGEIVKRLNKYPDCPGIAYFDEIAVARQYRGQGLGKQLAKLVCTWMVEECSNHVAFLRTHKNSPAFRIYTKLGYEDIQEDTQYGGGRVLMMASRCADIQIDI